MKKPEFTPVTEHASALLSFQEEPQLSEQIEVLLKEHKITKRLRALRALRPHYAGDLSQSRINYYVKRELLYLKTRLKAFLYLLLTMTLALVTATSLHNRYIQDFQLNGSRNTLDSAIRFFNDDDYPAAQVRLERLRDYGWTEYTVFDALSRIYQQQKEYDKAALILLDYIDHIHGRANTSTQNRAYLTLSGLLTDNKLSRDVEAQASSTLASVESSQRLYAQLFDCIHNQNYSQGASLCEELQQAGADGFYYASCYTTILIHTGQISEAYTYVMDFVRDENIVQRNILHTSQRKVLVNYILSSCPMNRLPTANPIWTMNCPPTTALLLPTTRSPTSPIKMPPMFLKVKAARYSTGILW